MKLLIKLLFFLLVVTSDRMFADDGKTFTNSIGMEFVLIPAGDFLMGCSPGDNNCNKEEKPAHNVKLTNDYYMGKYPVTQGQWKAVMGKNPSWFQRKRCPEKNKNCDNYPVEQVNLDDLQEFIKKLNSSEPGKNYRLPTEAEWEYAARGGTTTNYYWGNEMDGDYAWYKANSNGKTHPVGLKKPNAFGLYDTSGNVWEWTSDTFRKYSSSDEVDPEEDMGNEDHAGRGGSWDTEAVRCRVTSRSKWEWDSIYDLDGDEDEGDQHLGLRLSFSPFKKKETVVSKRFTNTLGMEFALIPAGEFLMGCTPGDKKCINDESAPVHKVKLTRSYYMGVYEVTQAQWKAVMGSNPSWFQGEKCPEKNRNCDNYPVEQVSWNDVQKFIKKLILLDPSKKYRLPTEAEWEYAARGGTTTKYFWGDKMDEAYVWYDANSYIINSPHPVGLKKPNAFGLYDILGNIWEWTADWFGNYSSYDQVNPKGPKSGTHRAFRGGSWDGDASVCDVSVHRVYDLGKRYYSRGFRLVTFP